MPVTTELYQLFEKIFREHYDSLANYALTILRSKEDAEDVVQDVFIKIWQNNSSIIESPGIKFYLLTAVKNNSISFLRKQVGKKSIGIDAAAVHILPEEKKAATPLDVESLVNQGLSQLPPQCAVIFKMSRFGKLTYQQIAVELDISVKTVENQVGKALRIMREFARKNDISLLLAGTLVSIILL